MAVADFQAIFDHTAAGLAVIRPGDSWVQLNPALQRMIGAPAQVTLEQIVELTHPDDREVDLELFRSVKRGEREGYRLEKRYLNARTGALVWGLLDVSLTRDPDGGPDTIYATVT